MTHPLQTELDKWRSKLFPIGDCEDIKDAATQLRGGTTVDFVNLEGDRWVLYRLLDRNAEDQEKVRELAVRMWPRLMQTSIA